MEYRVFLQARMSSRRFPGKMLAPLAGRPMIAWLLERLGAAVGRERLVLATSEDATDLPLAHFAERYGYQVFRGGLDNVFERFQACARVHPAPWVVRICGDSPMLDPGLIPMLLAHCHAGIDLVTNVATRTFPPGQSVEILSAETLQSVNAQELNAEECEHPTQVFYRNPARYSIRNIAATNPEWPRLSFVVDTLEDLRRLEPAMRTGAFPSFSAAVAA